MTDLIFGLPSESTSSWQHFGIRPSRGALAFSLRHPSSLVHCRRGRMDLAGFELARFQVGPSHRTCVRCIRRSHGADELGLGGYVCAKLSFTIQDEVNPFSGANWRPATRFACRSLLSLGAVT